MKKILKDLSILLLPMLIIFLLSLTPAMPDNIPIHIGLDGSTQTVSKHFAFLLGALPFIIYKSWSWKYKRK